MENTRVMVVFGTRPEAIKMAPLIIELKNRDDLFDVTTVVTAQHRQMLDQVLDIFNIVPDYDLNIMGKNQTLSDITVNILTNLSPILKTEKPDMILVHGDTTTTFATSLAAFYHQIPIGHVESGLRTWDKYAPFPEELNRQMTDSLADLYFAPTSTSKANLIKENRNEANIFITGNTAIDALALTVTDSYHHPILDRLSDDKRLILVTMHRRENQGEPMKRVLNTLKSVVTDYPDVEVVYPVHLSPAVQEAAYQILSDVQQIHLVEPLDVVDFHNLAAKSYFIMSDSGGIQEEAPSLNKPLLVLRDTTERPEGVKNGALKLVGTDENTIREAMVTLLTNVEVYNKMANATNPYGDGQASKRIVDAISAYFSKGPRPNDFNEGSPTT